MGSTKHPGGGTRDTTSQPAGQPAPANKRIDLLYKTVRDRVRVRARVRAGVRVTCRVVKVSS